MKSSPQSGIAIGPILFIIAILGVLAAAIAAGSGSFTAGTTTESAKSYASAFITYTDQVAQAVQRVTLGNGCDDSQISFDNGVFNNYWGGDPYANPNAPVDYHCHVFRPEGGGVGYVMMPAGAFSTFPYAYGSFDDGQYIITGAGMLNIGTANPDLTLFVGFLRKDVCLQINNLLGVANPGGAPPNVTGTCYGSTVQNGGFFTGSYVNNGVTWCGLNQTISACVLDPSAVPANYYFYRVLKIN
jgi:hypothetical protein